MTVLGERYFLGRLTRPCFRALAKRKGGHAVLLEDDAPPYHVATQMLHGCSLLGVSTNVKPSNELTDMLELAAVMDVEVWEVGTSG